MDEIKISDRFKELILNGKVKFIKPKRRKGKPFRAKVKITKTKFCTEFDGSIKVNFYIGEDLIAYLEPYGKFRLGDEVTLEGEGLDFRLEIRLT